MYIYCMYIDYTYNMCIYVYIHNKCIYNIHNKYIYNIHNTCIYDMHNKCILYIY